MTKVIFVGDMYYSDLSVGGGPMPGGPSVSHPIAPGGPPPGIWPGGGVPTHPIAPGGPPPGIWPGPGYPDQGLPGQPPGVWPSPGHPAHPIAPGGPPPGIWGGAPVPVPTPPIYLPPGSLPGVEHPIYIPPSVWPSPGVPTHPIVVPPQPEKPEVLDNWEVKTAWTPQSGWIVAIVPSEEHPGVPTPSEGRSPRRPPQPPA